MLDSFIRRDVSRFRTYQDIGISTRGVHVIADYHGCDPERLNHQKTIHSMLQQASEAAGATVLQVHVRSYSPQGLAGFALLANSHLSIHTWPEAGYAAADFYTCGPGEPRRAHDVMRRELLAGRAELVEIIRGLPGVAQTMTVRATEEESYGRRMTVHVDTRGGERHGVRVVRSANETVRLAAARNFSVTDVVFPLELVSYPSEAEFLLDTDFGVIPLDLDWTWLDISPKWFYRIPEPLSHRFCEIYRTDPDEWPQLFLKVTSGGARTRMVASFGEVAGHSEEPNTAPNFRAMSLEASGVLSLPFTATRNIAPGDEIVWDHRSLHPELVA